jgi:MFS family permease
LTDAAAPAFQGHGSKNYRGYVLGALLIVYTFNFIDRVVIGIIQEPIKAELGLTDFQLGLLGGPAFALLYTLLGIPVARFAERHNRMTILAICLGIWSVMTAACGFAQEISLGQQQAGAEVSAFATFIHSLAAWRVVGDTTFYYAPAFIVLLAARVGVGIGEAGCTPPANSVISDYFPPDRRASALSIYALGIPIGSMIAAVGGGWIATEVGWREAFIWLGVPGVLLAVIVKLTVKEPPRAVSAADTPSFFYAVGALTKKPTFWHVALGSALASFVGYGVGQYLTSFMIRTHGFSLFEAASIIGVVLGLCAAIGTFSSGFLADRISKRHPNALSWLPALGFAIATPLYLLSFVLPNIWMAMPALMIAAIAHYFYLGPMYAVTQGIVAPRMRATAVAVLLFVVNLIGYGMGPPVIGALSDFLANGQLAQFSLTTAACATPEVQLANATNCAAGVETGLRWAMMIGVLGYLWAGLHFLISARTLRRDWVA